MEVVAKDLIAEEVVQEVKEVAKPKEITEVSISVEEKLAVRDLELSFLKSQSQVQSLQASMADVQRNFTQYIENLSKKYSVDTKKFVFDAVSLSWKRLPEAK